MVSAAVHTLHTAEFELSSAGDASTDAAIGARSERSGDIDTASISMRLQAGLLERELVTCCHLSSEVDHIAQKDRQTYSQRLLECVEKFNGGGREDHILDSHGTRKKSASGLSWTVQRQKRR